MTTRASNDRPTRRLMSTAIADYVVELGAREIRIRPYRTRRGGSGEVQVGVGVLYQRLLVAGGRR